MKGPQQEVIGNYQALAWEIHHFRVCITGANATRSKIGRSGLVQKQLLRQPLAYSVVLTHSLHVLNFPQRQAGEQSAGVVIRGKLFDGVSAV